MVNINGWYMVNINGWYMANINGYPLVMTNSHGFWMALIEIDSVYRFTVLKNGWIFHGELLKNQMVLLSKNITLSVWKQATPKSLGLWVRNCVGDVFSRCAFLISCSVHFPCYLQNFGAGSCHFNGICNMLEFEPLGVHGICNISVLEVFILRSILQGSCRI